LIEAELTDTIGAALHERTESRINLRNGHRTRILSTTAGDRAPSSSASAARSRSRPTNDVNRAAGLGRSASSGGAAGSAVREGQQGSGPGAASPAPARATGPALEVGLPLRYNELVSNRGPVRRGVVRPGAVRGLPPAYLFVPLAEQLENVLRWNEDRQWGFAEAELDAIDLTPRTHPDPLVVDLLAVFLDAEYRGEDEGEMDGVRRTCHEMWSVAAERQLNTWCWDWIRDAYESRPKPVRLLPGVEHRPGVRRVTVDLGAHWTPGRHIRPRAIRGPASAHAEILAAAAHFPRWARAMDGVSVPFIWLAGYQVTYPAAATDERLLAMAWVQYRRTLSLGIARADHSFSGWAAPVRVR
jgi:hypothetical protein